MLCWQVGCRLSRFLFDLCVYEVNAIGQVCLRLAIKRQARVLLVGCFYFSADRHALTSRQADYSIKAGLPAGPNGPLIACRKAAKEYKPDPAI